MDFSSRHEQELAEIKALAQELDRRARGSLEELKRIKESQDDALDRVAPGNGEVTLLAFVHIPKTAGATVISMLTAAYSGPAVRDAGNYVRSAEKSRTKIAMSAKRGERVSAGHVPYGVFRDVLPSDTRYMTFLRDPVSRVLSHYYRHIHRKQQRSAKRRAHRAEVPGKIRTDAKADSLAEAIVEMRLPQVNNFATRFLSGQASPEMREALPPSALEEAKQSLREIEFVGIQERFEESLVLLRQMLDLGSVPYRDRHVSSSDGRPAVEEITDSERVLIEEYNAFDIELYKFGLELFEEALAAAGDGLAADVEALRAQSAADREEQWHQARAAG